MQKFAQAAKKLVGWITNHTNGKLEKLVMRGSNSVVVGRREVSSLAVGEHG